MIVGGYDLHLYCAVEGCYKGAPYPDGMGTFMDKTEASTKRQARRAGWKFTKGDCLCPVHAK